MAKSRSKKKKTAGLPSRDALLAWLTDNPDQSSKREVARAFGLKGQQKIALKAMLKDLAEEGTIKKRGKRFAKPGTLPNVTVLDIVTRDRDGGLLAKPVQWDESADGKAPSVAVLRDKSPKGKVPGVGDRVLARINTKATPPTARVMKILDRDRGATLGIYRAFDEPERGLVGRIEPVDRKQDELLVRDDAVGDATHGDLVEVSVQRTRHEGLKHARIEQVIGQIGSEKAISLIALHAHGIPHTFPDRVIAAAEDADAGKLGKREDWRNVPLITIDPADAKDHDDAIFAEPDNAENNAGGVIATVAIADVSWYVRPGTPLDTEARLRGNSVYFPDRVVPMLPERISNDLCSLKENEERPALAVRMTFTAEGRMLRHSFHRILMKSHARLSYQEAQAAIDGEDSPRAEPWLKSVLRPLWDAYAILKAGRANRAPLELDMPERKILLNEDGSVDRVIIPPRLDAHKLVEEFMIQANVAAAETLERKRQPLIYRVHDAPSLAKMESLKEFLKSLSIPLATSGQMRADSFNGILRQVVGKESEELVNSVVLRSQSQAIYDPVNIGHFGLNLRKYAHFTSPIRRYADLIVHRALVSALGLGEGGLPDEQAQELDVIAEEISMTERRAMVAERETVDRLIAHHLADRLGAEFAGRINGVTRAGMFITLDETGADGFVPISQIGDDYFIYDEVTHSVRGDTSGMIYQMGDRVQVRLVEAAPLAGALRFEMISDGREDKSVPRSKRSKSGSPSNRPKREKGSNRFGQRRSSKGKR